MIKEWNLLRFVACLSIVLLHSTTQSARELGYPGTEIYQFFRIFLCYATPAFIVLSVIILANRYPDKLPEKFWMNRMKWIYVPFLIFAILDAIIGKYFNPNLMVGQKILDNMITGKFVGWFILVIFQFYFLHYLVVRYKWSLKWLFPISMIIMFAYSFYALENPVSLEGYSHLLKLPFLGWFGYFTIAFIIGKHYKKISLFLYKYRWRTLLALGISILYLYGSFESGNVAVNSRRLDLYPLVISVSSVIIAWGQKIPKLNFIDLVSSYSFGIYLVHWQVLRFLAPYTAEYFTNPLGHVLSLFGLTLLISMMIIKLITLVPYGDFIIGKVKKKKTKETQVGNLPSVA
ncbi:acyltransferase family protein [Cytobacillus firmus]|uniref:acyltransferase family protein n=1 Tax=Cytobacillus firmus TaxID=1399 RepID=UPI0020407B37|nr:acyltransferase family protein [Cytobacillus firmus]MCM3705708.1 acyltransferase family protein [Cytobacillus firmus]